MIRVGRRQGKINVGCLFGAVILLTFVYLAFKFVPVKVHLAELQDAVKTEAQAGSMHKDGDIIFSLMRVIHDNNLPVKESDIKIERANSKIKISCDVEVKVELIGGKIVPVKEHIEAEAPLF